MTLVNDRYQLRQIIGTGGMSEVYSAEDVVLGREVAVKMLRPEMARDVNFRERFRREAQNSGKLNHPNIVAVFDTGELDDDGLAIPYIVMERIHGHTLRDIIREDGALPASEAAEILKPVADALQASHEAGIIHRDVKPANIMLTNTGQVKVMDFGIARALDDSTSAMTQTSAVIGTAQYLSPEQARGKPADARSDVYALGCVMYEAITARTPFEGETPFAVAYQHVQEEPTPPSELIDDPSLTPTQRVNMDAVVLTAMAKHPADRYQSAWEMGDDLDLLAANKVTNAARAHIGDAEEQPTQQAPVASTRPVEEPAEEDEGSATWMKWLAAILGAVLVALMAFFAWDFFQSDGSDDTEQTQDANTVIVPEVENRPRAEVVAELEEMGLLVTVNEEANPDIERGNAIRINPAAGSELQKNSSVTLTVSSGREITDVPDVTGMSVDEARQALSDAGLELNPNIEESNDDNVPAGQVISQNPSGGSQISKGSEVRLTVSLGQEQVRVPDVTGLNRSQAVSMLESMDFDVEVNAVDSLEPEDQVLSASDEGNEIGRGSTVTLEVSNGMLIKAPDLVRLNEEQAVRELREAGWTGSRSDLIVREPIPTGAAVDSGKIGWTNINPGQNIRKDEDVEIGLWRFEVDALLP